MKTRVGLGLGVACIVTAIVAGAQGTGRVALRWSAPEGCPSSGAVVAEVDRLLGASSARPAKALDVSATVSVEAGSGFRVRLETPGESGPRTREVKSASCQGVADATALIIALMIDPSAAANAPPRPTAAQAAGSGAPSGAPAPSVAPTSAVPTPSVAPTAMLTAVLAPVVAPTGTGTAATATTAAAAPTRAPRSPPPPPPEPGPPIGFRISAAALVDAGSLPGVSFAFTGAAAIAIGPYRLELGAVGWPNATGTLAATTSAGGRVDLVAGFASACRDVLPLFTKTALFELFPCVAVEVGRLHATGFGVDSPGEGEALWSAVRAGGLFVWAPIERLGIDLRVEAALPFARPRFVIDGEGAVHRPEVVAGRLSVGAEARF